MAGWPALATAALLAVIVLCQSHVDAVKLKFNVRECLTHHLEQYEPFYGSFVALPDAQGQQAQYSLTITSPSGSKVHETVSAMEDKFHLVPYESGDYKFCLTCLARMPRGTAPPPRQVVWDLYTGHADNPGHDHAQEQDTHNLWHYVHLVDAQLQQLRSTLSYLYWRERRHRMTVDSTNQRVLWFAILRASALVLVSIAQVLGICYLFRPK